VRGRFRFSVISSSESIRTNTELLIRGRRIIKPSPPEIHHIILKKKHTSQWVDNIRMDLGEVGWGDVDWIVLAKDRIRWRAVVNSVLNLRVP
jgi:hypothetical protein